MIQVRDVEFSYGKQEVLKGISFCMEKGEFVCVLGANRYNIVSTKIMQKKR